MIRVKLDRAIDEFRDNITATETLKFLGAVMELDLVNSDSRDMHIAEFVCDQFSLDVISKSVDAVENMRVRSRLYDMLQIHKRKKFDNARLAVAEYWEIGEGEESLRSKRENVNTSFFIKA